MNKNKKNWRLILLAVFFPLFPSVFLFWIAARQKSNFSDIWVAIGLGAGLLAFGIIAMFSDLMDKEDDNGDEHLNFFSTAPEEVKRFNNLVDNESSNLRDPDYLNVISLIDYKRKRFATNAMNDGILKRKGVRKCLRIK